MYMFNLNGLCFFLKKKVFWTKTNYSLVQSVQVYDFFLAGDMDKNEEFQKNCMRPMPMPITSSQWQIST